MSNQPNNGSPTAGDDPPPTILLQFDKRRHDWQEKPKKMRESVSALVQWDNILWVASDQTATVERLVADDADHPTVYSGHQPFRLIDFVPLPNRGTGKPDQEVDLEGIDFQKVNDDTGYLWLVGSHSHARGKVDDITAVDDGIKALRTVSLDVNRCALIRIPVIRRDGHLPELLSTCPDPRNQARTLTAGMLSSLLTTIAVHEHFKHFFTRDVEGGVVRAGVPGKDNGLDIEGLAVSGDRIFLGLRGPVLRGWSVILQLEIDEEPVVDGAAELRLRRTADDQPFRTYFLQLGGLGVRELYADGEDLLILTGPTMDLDNPVRIHRWTDGATGTSKALVPAQQLPVVKELRTGKDLAAGTDHPEGFTKLTTTEGQRLIVAYDSPANSRTETDGAVQIDSYPWP